MCMRSCSLRYRLQLSGIRCLNVIDYLPVKLYDIVRARRKKFYMYFTMLVFAPDSISRISSGTTYFYVYLAGDQTWTVLLGDVCSRELPYLAITSSAQTTRHAFGNSSSSHARGMGVTSHLACLRRLVYLPCSGDRHNKALGVLLAARLALLLGAGRRKQLGVQKSKSFHRI
jgi:hypothetical protein